MLKALESLDYFSVVNELVRDNKVILKNTIYEDINENATVDNFALAGAKQPHCDPKFSC